MAYELLSQSRKLNMREVLIRAGWLGNFFGKIRGGVRLLGTQEYTYGNWWNAGNQVRSSKNILGSV